MENALLKSDRFRPPRPPHAADSRPTIQPYRFGRTPVGSLARLRRFRNSMSAIADRIAAAST
jgi:hypothetical protein